MTAKSALGLVPRQGIALSPAMRQSLALLRMPTLAAAEAIAREAEENPFLVVEPPPGGVSAYDVALDRTAAEVGLGENLRRQIALQRLSPEVEAAALYLAGELRGDGYLDVGLDELAAETGAPLDVLEDGLAALHACEPAGIGARTLGECLALKLFDAGVAAALAAKVVTRLDDFAEERWPRLARDLGVARDVLERIAGLLRGFGSAPVVADAEWVQVMVPEVSVEIAPDGTLSVTSIAGALPGVATMAVTRGALQDDALRTLYDRAQRVTASVSARRETLLRVAALIADIQSAFFLGGHDTLVPLSRAEAAATLVMHPTTLGRAVASKALMAGGKVYPMAMFFSRGVPGRDGELSPFDVQRRIRNLISQEMADAPLSDDRIQAQLYHEGVDIARRTVAKYRKCMRIPSSFGRKRRRVS